MTVYRLRRCHPTETGYTNWVQVDGDGLDIKVGNNGELTALIYRTTKPEYDPAELDEDDQPVLVQGEVHHLAAVITNVDLIEAIRDDWKVGGDHTAVIHTAVPTQE